MPDITGSGMPRLVKALKALGFVVKDEDDLQARINTGYFVQADDWEPLLKAFERLGEWIHEGGVNSDHGLGCMCEYVQGVLGYNKGWDFRSENNWRTGIKDFVQVEGERDAEMKRSFQENFKTLFMLGKFTSLKH